MRPRVGWPPTSFESVGGHRAVPSGRPTRRPLFQVQNRWKACRCQAMTVSGLTMTSAAGHWRHTRASPTQNTRSALVRRSRRGRDRPGRESGGARPAVRGAGPRVSAPSERVTQRDKNGHHPRQRTEARAATSTATIRSRFLVGTPAGRGVSAAAAGWTPERLPARRVSMAPASNGTIRLPAWPRPAGRRPVTSEVWQTMTNPDEVLGHR